MLLLVVEDDDRVASALAGSLRRHGFDVVRARTGTLALDLLNSTRPDLVLLDLGLPDRDGFDICTRIRLISAVPVIMVTARAEQADRLRGLYTGADDYIVKPFDVLELIARIHVVTRRSRRHGDEATGSPAEPARGGPDPGRTRAWPPPSPVLAGPGQHRPGALGADGDQVLSVGKISIDLRAREVTVAGRETTLTRKEFNLLAQLAGAPGVVFRREQIVAEVWGYSPEGASHTLEVHIASLRAKLGVPGAIETVRGIGYRLSAKAVG
ncbi:MULTISPECIES: response regulator transcription factor [Pseudofrankia]|uniref:response regulator transcription factor n=1 Tax=Pseudofrankia TaxID=2994363 RepID=UPI000234CE34|nr:MULTISPECIES: response regulator [Pseudofrankia]OHV30762.1 hypothetical protein BCD49_33445 [Pseudofrankia sp. EUN1h]